MYCKISVLYNQIYQRITNFFYKRLENVAND